MQNVTDEVLPARSIRKLLVIFLVLTVSCVAQTPPAPAPANDRKPLVSGIRAIPNFESKRTFEGDPTMRFMMLMIPKGYEKAAPGAVPDAKAVAAMMKYNETLQKAGVLLALDGLHPPSMGARVSFAGGKPKVTDGPFSEAKEVLGGYWLIQAKSKEEAVEWASRCPASENEVIEVRQVQEFGDFPADVQEAAAGFREMKAEAGSRGQT
jgi:hypothetical protein